MRRFLGSQAAFRRLKRSRLEIWRRDCAVSVLRPTHRNSLNAVRIPPTMELPLRSIATLVLAVAVASCSDTPNAPVKLAAGKSRILLAPRFSPEASAVYAQRAEIAGVQFDRVRVRIVRPPSEVVVDTTITFGPNSSPVTLDLTVEARQAGEIFDGAIDYTSNGTVVFHGQTKVQSYGPEEPAPAQQEILIEYVGVGANAARVTLTPPTT